MWDKVMKEVREKRYAGPFEKPPFKHFMQSPIGLVPKSNGQTRLIFHLSYDFESGGKSFNYHTPEELGSVKYKDLDHAVKNCIRLIRLIPNCLIWGGITDLKSAFRIVPGRRDFWPFLMMNAVDPSTGRIMLFIDKNLPFGAEISCKIFQDFSDCLAHLFGYVMGDPMTRFRVTNYLDDFLFIAPGQMQCNEMVSIFENLCTVLGVPIAREKIVYATLRLKFLGIIIDGENRVLRIPHDKKDQALHLLKLMIEKKKATVKTNPEYGRAVEFPPQSNLYWKDLHQENVQQN